MSADRAARRREARALAKQATRQGAPRVAGVITDTGQWEQAAAMGRLPAKVPGRHRWIATAAYVVPEAMVRNEVRWQTGDQSGGPTYLDHEARFDFSLGCWDCEEPLGVITPDTPCPAPANPAVDGPTR